MTRSQDQTQAKWPVTIALVLILAVWLAACVISFMEQHRLAERFNFEMAWLFPLIFDGLASALAVTSWASALDGRHSPLLRLVTMLAVSGSAWVNAAAVMERSPGSLDVTQVGMAVAAPICAWVAFEFLLSEMRRQIMRSRGVPAPAAVPALRPVRVLLSPFRSVREWRNITLDVTDPRNAVATDGDRSGMAPPVPETSLDPVPAAADSVPAADRHAGTESDWQAESTQPMAAVRNGRAARHPEVSPAVRNGDFADHGQGSGTLITVAEPAADPAADRTERVPERAGTDTPRPNGAADPAADPSPVPETSLDPVPERHATVPPAAAETSPRSAPDGDRNGGTETALDIVPPATADPVPAAAVPAQPGPPDDDGPAGPDGAAGLDPAAALRARGATVPPAAALAEMPPASLREAARRAWRQASEAGHPVSGLALGEAFGKSDRWGRAQITAVRRDDESVITLAEHRS